jgi:hypothetical protein
MIAINEPTRQLCFMSSSLTSTRGMSERGEGGGGEGATRHQTVWSLSSPRCELSLQTFHFRTILRALFYSRLALVKETFHHAPNIHLDIVRERARENARAAASKVRRKKIAHEITHRPDPFKVSS